MLSPQEIQAFYTLSGVFFLSLATVFYYFKDKVDEHVFLKTKEIFSSPENSKMIEQIRKGKVPASIIRDFASELGRSYSARRRLNMLFLLLPTIGLLFLFSALMASVITSENGFALSIVTTSEYLSYAFLVAAIILFICSVYQTVRLAREL